MDYKNFFKGKRITLMGLGLLGRGVGDAEFLAEMGADLIVTDLKTEKELAESVKRIKRCINLVSGRGETRFRKQNVRFVLGKHKLEDFSAQGGQARPDFILKGAGVSLDSPFIAEARKNKIPIEMDASLFTKLAPNGVKIIGVTGTRGKTTTTMLIYEILKRAISSKSLREVRPPSRSEGGLTSLKSYQPRVFLGGNIKDMATLPLLKEVREGDYVVMELDSWQLQGFGPTSLKLRRASDAKGLSPNVSVFTTFYPDHLKYYGGSMERYFEDKSNIFRFQKKRDVLIVGEQAAEKILSANPPVSPIVARATDVPKEWTLKLLGEHNRANAMCAILAARALKIPDEIIKEAVENFTGVPGRLELIREINGVKIYNDTTSTTPTATIAGLRALGNPASPRLRRTELKRSIVLILGGDDKNLDMSELIAEIPKWSRAVVMFKERGTERIKNEVLRMKNKGLEVFEEEGLEATVKRAFSIAKPGEIILYSPAFSSFGKYFKNEYDRGEQFVRLVNNLE